jgi:hypothetical protein
LRLRGKTLSFLDFFIHRISQDGRCNFFQGITPVLFVFKPPVDNIDAAENGGYE